MRRFKFRAFDFNLGKYKTFYLSELLINNPDFEFIDQDKIQRFLYRNPKTKEEYYEGDQIGFNRQRRPLFIQSALIIVDNIGEIYQWDERFFDEPNDVFPPWVKGIEYAH